MAEKTSEGTRIREAEQNARIAELEAEVERLRRLNKDLSERTLELFSLFELAYSLGGARFDRLHDGTLDFIGELMGIDLFSLMLYDNEEGVLRIKAALGLSDEVRENFSVRPPEGIAGYVFASAQAMYVPDVDVEPRYKQLQDHGVDEGSLLAIPLLDDDHSPFGVLNISKPEKNAFSESDQGLYSTVALQIATMIQNYTTYRQLKELSLTDELTGVGNRRHFFQTLEDEHMRHKRSALPYTLLLIDVDYFKQFNDTHGHLEGDIALVELAQIFRSRCRNSDLVARYGGEEFAVCAVRTSKQDAFNLAQALRRGVDENIFRLRDGSSASQLSITIGVASFPEDGRTYQDVLEHADQALYFGKSRGRNTVIAYPVPLPEGSQARGAKGDTPGRRGKVDA
ncbi:MAG: sensor domain-containing diguanylate cyclase [Candidatus Lernaella stagnicola]|nr:sensor domain-containing diguanylate cyclase [Candidatus Lernaella stagnicola]